MYIKHNSQRIQNSTWAYLLIVMTLSSLASANSPNFVLVLTDDQSWNGTSVQMDPNVPGSKSDFYQTPRLEELAAAGMRFSNGYSATPVCATTRASLQTGISAAQLQMSDMPHALPAGGTNRWNGHFTRLPLTPPMPEPFSTDHTSIAHVLKQADPNYVAAHYGKWHLNHISLTSPTTVGYDMGQDVTPLPPNEVDPWGVFKMADMASAFMTDRVTNNEPFYLQLSHRAVHSPVRSREEIRQKYENLPPGTIHKNVPYAAMTEDLDTSLGMVMDKVTELGIEENTYFIFVSDNGAPTTLSSSFPLRKGKANIAEGGIRVPFVVKGPEIQAGSVSSVPVTTTDLYATIADLAGHQGPMPETVESGNFAPVLKNGGQLPAGMDHISRNFHEGEEIYFHWPHNFGIGRFSRTRPSSAIRDGDYKLQLEYGENGAPDVLKLYNLVNDISESTNLASAMPEKTEELKRKLLNYLERIDASLPYDVKTPVTIDWNANHIGPNANAWRSANNLDYKAREVWREGTDDQKPVRQTIAPHQPNLPHHAYAFDGNDVMEHKFFHVGDVGPRHNTVDPGTPDFDRSTTLEFWVRFDELSSEQILFESGDEQRGISATMGDADSDGQANDLRFRILGLTGPEGGLDGTLKSLDVTAKIDGFSDPTKDFTHLVAVFNDDPNDRFAEIYVNGALAARVDGLLGIEESLQWDGYDDAGLGNTGGSGIGANAGSGDLPFSGGLTGELALVRFRNHALSQSDIRDNYNEALWPVWRGIAFASGGASVPVERPADVSLGAFESSIVRVMQERDDTLDDSLSVDALITGPELLNASDPGTSGNLAAGTDFTSYLLQFDPTGENGAANESVAGSITFDREILAILLGDELLVETDVLLGSIGNYGDQADRGLELSGSDFLSVSSDLHTLSFSLSIPGDQMLQFRVLTEQLVPGDFNFDGVVDGADLAHWQASFGTTDGADADGDGDTDGADFLAWQRNYSGASQTAAASQVPEPTTAAFAILATMAMCTKRRKGPTFSTNIAR